MLGRAGSEGCALSRLVVLNLRQDWQSLCRRSLLYRNRLGNHHTLVVPFFSVVCPCGVVILLHGGSRCNVKRTVYAFNAFNAFNAF